jgi:hypothetical protein
MNRRFKGLLLSLCALALATMLRADGPTNARQLTELRALSFSTAKKVSVATLSAPAKGEKAVYHGCAMRTEWKEAPEGEGQALADVLRELIADRVACYAKAGDADIVWLQPLGFVYGQVALQLETDHGRREFSITPGEKTSYVYAYDTKHHSLCLVVDGPLQTKLIQSLSRQTASPTPASATSATSVSSQHSGSTGSGPVAAAPSAAGR